MFLAFMLGSKVQLARPTENKMSTGKYNDRTNFEIGYSNSYFQILDLKVFFGDFSFSGQQ